MQESGVWGPAQEKTSLLAQPITINGSHLMAGVAWDQMVKPSMAPPNRPEAADGIVEGGEFGRALAPHRR